MYHEDKPIPEFDYFLQRKSEYVLLFCLSQILIPLLDISHCQSIIIKLFIKAVFRFCPRDKSCYVPDVSSLTVNTLWSWPSTMLCLIMLCSDSFYTHYTHVYLIPLTLLFPPMGLGNTCKILCISAHTYQWDHSLWFPIVTFASSFDCNISGKWPLDDAPSCSFIVFGLEGKNMENKWF